MRERNENCSHSLTHKILQNSTGHFFLARLSMCGNNIQALPGLAQLSPTKCSPAAWSAFSQWSRCGHKYSLVLSRSLARYSLQSPLTAQQLLGALWCSTLETGTVATIMAFYIENLVVELKEISYSPRLWRFWCYFASDLPHSHLHETGSPTGPHVNELIAHFDMLCKDRFS